jgi:hypothetical protein
MSKTIARNSFVLYQDNSDIFESLKKEQQADLIMAIFAYQKTGELPNDPFIKIAISSFISQFKRDSQKWEKTCEEKTISGKMGNLKRWHPELHKKVINGEITLEKAMQGLQPEKVSQPDRTQSNPIGNVANIAVNVSDNVSVSVNDIINDIKPTKKPKGFIAPSLQEVSDYCQERKNTVNPQKWMDHYQSNGWKVGRNSMKDWKAAIRTWEKNSFENKSDPTTFDSTQWSKY